MTLIASRRRGAKNGLQLSLFEAADESKRTKLRGGYYTPPRVAHWMCEWALRQATDRVLEPSAGDGNFVVAAADVLHSRGATDRQIVESLTAVEIDAREAERACRRLRADLSAGAEDIVVCSDFFQWAQNNSERRYDAVIGNPPFIRYQNFPEPSRSRAMALLSRFGFRSNKLTNIWVPFVVGSAALLAEGGRMALVIPAELLQVTYAAPLRSFLVDQFRSIDIFACNEMIFDGAEQEVVILFADGKLPGPSPDNRCGVDLRAAESVQHLLSLSPHESRQPSNKLVKHDSEKWLKYFLSAREISFMRRLRESGSVKDLSHHAAVDVGVVTGENAFFVLDAHMAKAKGLESACRRLVGRSAQLRGAILTAEEWGCLAQGGHRAYLLALSRDSRDALSADLLAYIEKGERDGVHRGYKCSIRDPWYAVPAVWPPDCFMFRQIYDFPRLVVNRARAISTDTIHRVTCRCDPERLVSNFFTHLTAASSEIEGRSYGGGVLELEPTEAERLMIPMELHAGIPVAEIDALVRDGRLGDALAENDRLILQGRMGLSRNECRMLKSIWEKMRQRRITRRKAKRITATTAGY